MDICNKKLSSTCSEKFLGIKVDNKFTFEEHVEGLCKKACQKFGAVARISSLMRFEQRKRAVNLFITSHFSYCPLVWIFFNRRLNNRINHIHERVYEDYNFSFKELLRKRQFLNINVLINCQKQKPFRILWKILLTTEAVVKNNALAQVFFCELCEISRNTFFTDYLWLLLYWNLTDYMLSERLKNTFKRSEVCVLF